MIESVDYLIRNFSNKRIVLNFSDKEYDSTVRCNLHQFFEVHDDITFIVLDCLKEILRTNVYEDTISKLKVILFSASWCQPCRKMAPEYETLPTEFSNIVFDKIDVDSGNELIDRCEISSIPTLVVFDGNEILFKSQEINKLRQFLNSKVPAKISLEASLDALEIV